MQIDYYATAASPWCYLGHARLKAIADKYNASINLIPVSFGTIFPQTGGLPLPKRAPARRANRLQELRRWRNVTGVPLNLQPQFHPYDDTLANLTITAAVRQGQDGYTLAGACMRATFYEERNLADKADLQDVASKAGFDGPALVQAAETDDAVRAEFTTNTEKALSRNVFGAPTYIVGEELYWGQDRLDFIERQLAAIG